MAADESYQKTQLMVQIKYTGLFTSRKKKCFPFMYSLLITQRPPFQFVSCFQRFNTETLKITFLFSKFPVHIIENSKKNENNMVLL